ncbi:MULTISPECIES: TetR/AcrR family transcriptional regulator [unclassified Streptomyces]|uniref:TetR/AcrR family transcriptional regulator n=1 Tax=unclassified Streptomyces TaxID=2593676 RepID=UPI0036676E9A
MTTQTPEPTAPRPPGSGGRAGDARRRDAAGTRRLLLDAARHRFARDGYSGTTVRDIADDAGVNVALINRYFTSKEGLFAACLTGSVNDLERAVAADLPLDQVPLSIAGQLTSPDAGEFPHRLLLLLRSSGDERADEIRLQTLRSFSERLAAAAGRQPGDADGDRHLLHAQIVLAASFGIVMLRASTALEPLASAGEQDLLPPLRDLISALLPPK